MCERERVRERERREGGIESEREVERERELYWSSILTKNCYDVQYCCRTF